MKTILVPTDFSKPAQWAVEAAGAIALKANAKVILLHIIEQDSPQSFNAEAQVETSELWEDRIFLHKLIERRKKQLADTSHLLIESGVQTKQELRLGNAFHGINHTILEQEADLIVMGTSGNSRFDEMWVGSNTEKVIRSSKCPVLTIHEQWDKKNFENIVYATSLSDREKEFSTLLKTTQEIFESKVHLLRVNTPMNFQSDHNARKAMEEFARKNKLHHYTINVYSAFSEEEGILHFAESINADLIAMATQGRTGLSRVLASSIAEKVANHASRPVLTLLIK